MVKSLSVRLSATTTKVITCFVLLECGPPSKFAHRLTVTLIELKFDIIHTICFENIVLKLKPNVYFTDTVNQLSGKIGAKSVKNEITTTIFIPRIKVCLKPTMFCCNSLRFQTNK